MKQKIIPIRYGLQGLNLGSVAVKWLFCLKEKQVDLPCLVYKLLKAKKGRERVFVALLFLFGIKIAIGFIWGMSTCLDKIYNAHNNNTRVKVQGEYYYVQLSKTKQFEPSRPTTAEEE